jgi:hypothetical protein
MVVKSVIVVMLLLIVASLISALVLLVRGKGRSATTAKALTWRIGLSLALFLLLMAGLHFGYIPAGGLSSAPGR